MAAKADRILVLVAYLIGLGYTNHMAGLLVAPAVGLAVLLVRWQHRPALEAAPRLRCSRSCFGITPFAIAAHPRRALPGAERGRADRVPRQGSTSRARSARGRTTRSCTTSIAASTASPSCRERQAPFSAQIGMWWLYFKWQWLRDAHDEHPGAQSVLAALFLVLGLAGRLRALAARPTSFWFFGPLMFTVTLALIYYLNFKYGASQAPDLAGSRARCATATTSTSGASRRGACGRRSGSSPSGSRSPRSSARERVTIGRETVERPTRRALAIASPVLALALIPLVTNWTTASRAGQTDTRDCARDLLNSVEPYGVLVTVGDNDTFPLWYAQEVEGVRQDVIVAVTSLLNTDWYTRQLIRRPVYEYDAAKGPGGLSRRAHGRSRTGRRST